ncbi:hypothetical protein PInf_005029 [Phytophthora infestans]|nr:hypothetical protein PInf_005029 [Phytophthora infestans]
MLFQTYAPFEQSLRVIMGELRRDRKWSMQVTALYDYEPEQSDELRFIEGDVLRVLQVQDDGWWSGYNVESPNVIGIFPSNYVQALRTVFKMQSAKSLVDAGRTPRPPASSRQRIELQFRQGFATSEIEDGDEDDKVEETRTDNRGAILLLRQNLEQAERASQAVRDARRQAERERRRHRKCWRERGHDEDTDEEEHLGQHAVDVNYNGNEDDTEDEEEAAPQLQGDMHETKCQEADEGQVDKISDTIEKKGRVQTEQLRACQGLGSAKTQHDRFGSHSELMQRSKQEEEQRRNMQQSLDNEQEQWRLNAVKEEVHCRFIEAEMQNEESVIPSRAPSSSKSRRKVMKKEAVDLIKKLVQQQLEETLRDHDAKMDELQRMVSRLQTVVRKQTAMLEDSTYQLMNLQVKQHQQKMPMSGSNWKFFQVVAITAASLARMCSSHRLSTHLSGLALTDIRPEQLFRIGSVFARRALTLIREMKSKQLGRIDNRFSQQVKWCLSAYEVRWMTIHNQCELEVYRLHANPEIAIYYCEHLLKLRMPPISSISSQQQEVSLPTLPMRFS